MGPCPLLAPAFGCVFADVQAIINEEGKVESHKLAKKLGAGCDEEAIRVLKKSKFKPGYDKGKPVKVRFTLPVFFRL